MSRTVGIILAEGLAAESYLDTGNRHAFVNAEIVTERYPDIVAERNAGRQVQGVPCAPLMIEGRAVQRVRRRLRERLVAARIAALPSTKPADPRFRVAARTPEYRDPIISAVAAG